MPSSLVGYWLRQLVELIECTKTPHSSPLIQRIIEILIYTPYYTFARLFIYQILKSDKRDKIGYGEMKCGFRF